MTTIVDKHPSDVQILTVTWTLDTGETISTSTWASDPSGLTVDSDSETTTTTTVTFSAGLKGVTYKLQNTITTSAGRTLVRYVEVRCRDVPL